MAAVPVGNALECVTGGDQTGFIEVAANKLECDRTAAFRDAAWKGNGWTSCHVKGTAEAQQARDKLRILAQRCHFAEGRCRERLGRHGKKIDLFEHRPHHSLEGLAA